MDIPKLKRLALTIRMLSADAVEEANSGHPGMPMGAADYAALLWAHYLRINPKEPSWIARDRFVLSAGHGSMLLYSLLHLFGYNLSLDEIKRFRQWQSKTPGHPEFEITQGVECTTGPLGQGFGNGVGMAISARLMASRYSEELFSSRVFGIVSDGDLMEGVSAEAASLAGHLGLGNLIYLYDDNKISIGGHTDVCFTEDVAKRFEAYGWQVQKVDGHDMEAVSHCLDQAISDKERPSLICARTTIGYGSPNKANDAEVHGAPLGEEELNATKRALGWPSDKRFFVPSDVGEFCCELTGEKSKEYELWLKKFKSWEIENKEKAQLLDSQLNLKVPAKLSAELLEVMKLAGQDATRNLSGKAIQVIAKHVPFFIGGSADLEPSTKTLIKGSSDIQKDDFSGRNIRFGVREHAMGAICNGLAYGRCWIPYSSTFLVFSDYMRPAIRLAALSHIQSLFIFTHDSFWVGEDGPTHQPIEHIAALRCIPNLYVFRPADALETAHCYLQMLSLKKSPSALLLTRQNTGATGASREICADGVARGAYSVYGDEKSELVIVATGSELAPAVEAAKMLSAEKVFARVVSMPCQELFLQQDKSLKEALIPPSAKKISIEAGSTFGWERIVGSKALMIGLDHFGASAPGKVTAEKFGFTAQAIKQRILNWLS